MKYKKELLELADLWERRAKKYEDKARYMTESFSSERLLVCADAYRVAASELRERLKEQNYE